MKTLPLLLLSLLSLNAQPELWYLDMPKTHGDYLLKKFTEGNLEAYQKVLDRIPGLIEDGTIREIEHIEANNKSGGKNFPMYQEDGKTRNRNVSKYNFSRNDEQKLGRIFTIPFDASAMKTLFKTFGALSKTYTPSLAILSKDKVKIALERDQEASAEFLTPASIASSLLSSQHPREVIFYFTKNPFAESDYFTKFRVYSPSFEESLVASQLDSAEEVFSGAEITLSFTSMGKRKWNVQALQEFPVTDPSKGELQSGFNLNFDSLPLDQKGPLRSTLFLENQKPQPLKKPAGTFHVKISRN